MVMVMAMLGAPPALYTGAGAALRESYRQFFTSTVKAWAALIEAELRDKLEIPNLSLRFPEIAQSDIAARARAAGSLIQAGGDFTQRHGSRRIARHPRSRGTTGDSLDRPKSRQYRKWNHNRCVYASLFDT